MLSWTDNSVDCNVCVHNMLLEKLFLSGIKNFFIKCGGKRKIIKNHSVILMFHQACQWNRNMIKCMAKTTTIFFKGSKKRFTIYLDVSTCEVNWERKRLMIISGKRRRKEKFGERKRRIFKFTHTCLRHIMHLMMMSKSAACIILQVLIHLVIFF